MSSGTLSQAGPTWGCVIGDVLPSLLHLGVCHWGTYNLTHLVMSSGQITFESGKQQDERISKWVKLYVPQ